jgi:hypothetical protein
MADMPGISVICWVDPDNPVLEATLQGYVASVASPEISSSI